jgi:hypothetical protein
MTSVQPGAQTQVHNLLGSGHRSALSFPQPAGGSKRLATLAGPDRRTGWASDLSDQPVRQLTKGTERQWQAQHGSTPTTAQNRA